MKDNTLHWVLLSKVLGFQEIISMNKNIKISRSKTIRKISDYKRTDG